MLQPATTLTSPAVDRSPDSALSGRALATRRSLLRELVGMANAPGVLSLAGGLPDPELFPTVELREAFDRSLNDPLALQYGAECEPLKRQIVGIMLRRGVVCTPDEIVITSGAQQGIHILARLFLDGGGQVAMEEFAYTGMHQAIAPLTPERLVLPAGRRGLDVDALELALEGGHRPAFLYLVADHCNPTGSCLPLDARLRIAALARSYGLPIVEDDPYGLLTFEGETSPALRSFEPDWVFYAGSFSKIISPGLRLGWIVLPSRLVERAGVMREAMDLESSALIQRSVAAYLSMGALDDHLEQARALYGSRRDAMLRYLQEELSDLATWNEPKGGMFVWVELASAVDTLQLLERSLASEKIAFVPGAVFASRPGDGGRFLRLSYSMVEPDQIRDGVRGLARLLREECA